MISINVYEVGEEFFDKDLGCKVRCVADGTGCISCVYFDKYIGHSSIHCDLRICYRDMRTKLGCASPEAVHFEKVEEDEAGNS